MWRGQPLAGYFFIFIIMADNNTESQKLEDWIEEQLEWLAEVQLGR